MSEARFQVTVDAPLAAVYKQWTLLDAFPEFLDQVASVSIIDDTYSRWLLTGSREREFDAEILELLPEERIEWRTLNGDLHFHGQATFREKDDDRTTVTVTIRWEPTTRIAKAGAALGADKRLLREALRSFKRHVEATGGPPGRSHVALPAIPSGDEATP